MGKINSTVYGLIRAQLWTKCSCSSAQPVGRNTESNDIVYAFLYCTTSGEKKNNDVIKPNLSP